MTVFEEKKNFFAKINSNESMDVHCIQFIDCDNEVGYHCISFDDKMNFDMIKRNIKQNHSLIIWACNVFNFRYVSIKGKDAIELNRMADDFMEYYNV